MANTGSIVGTQQTDLANSFRPKVMVGVGDPNDVVIAVSGTILRDFTNDALYMNNSAGTGAGSSWQTYT